MSTTDPSPKSRAATGGLSPVLMRALIALAIVLLIAFGLYWAGLRHGRAQMTQQKTSYEARLKEAQTQAVAAQSQVAALQSQNLLMTARGLLYQAAIALDQRNFGTAGDDVGKAGQALTTAQPANPAEDASLNDVRQAVAGTKIAVAQDLDDQRSHLLDMAAQLNALIH